MVVVTPKRRGLSPQAFAAVMGVSTRLIYAAIENGRIPRSALFDDGSIDEAPATVHFLAKAQLSRRIERDEDKPATVRAAERASAAAGADASVEESLTSMRTKVRMQQVELETAEHKLRTLQGSTIPKTKVRKFIRDWNLKTRSGLLNFATRRGPSLAARLGVDEVTLVAELEADMREHLVDLADEPLPMSDDAPDDADDAEDA